MLEQSLPWRIAQLPPAKKNLMSLLLEKQGADFNCFPLSFSQDRLWVFDRLSPGSAAYNIPRATRLTGRLDPDALRRSLAELGRRHEVLRTAFLDLQGLPLQAVLPPAPFRLPIQDLRRLPEDRRLEEARRLAAEEARLPFDLARGRLLRSRLLCLGDEEHVWLLTLHHIVSDAWSSQLLLSEASQLYEAFCQGKPSPLPEPEIQYADYAAWQRSWLRGPEPEEQLAYWKERLDGMPRDFGLATDRPRPPAPTYRGASLYFDFPEELTQRLRNLSQRQGATLYMVLLAAFQALLQQATGKADIAVYSPIANRNHPQTESLVGFFVNMLILRSDLSGDPSFVQLIESAKAEVLGAFSNQDLPFERLLDELGVRREIDQAPLTRVGFTVQSPSDEAAFSQDLHMEPFALENRIARIDFLLFVVDSGGQLSGAFEYSRDLFEPSTIESLQDQFVQLLEAAAADPEQRLSHLPPLPARPAVGDLDYQGSNLTASQLNFWLGQQLRPGDPLFNMAYTLTVQGPLEKGRLLLAFQTLIESCDILRSVIAQRGGLPQLTVLEDFAGELECVDLSCAPEPERAVREWVERRARVPFDLDKSLFEAALLTLAGDCHVLYVNHHHTIGDALSTAVFCRKWLELYDRSEQQELPRRIELPTFADFVRQEREFQGTPRYLRAQAFWDSRLAEELQPISFYGRMPERPAERGQRISVILNPERREGLHRLASQPGIFTATSEFSLHCILATVLLAFLHCISGSRRLGLGVAYHNRASRPLADTIGLLISILPLRVRIAAGETFATLFAKVASETLDSLKHARFIPRNPVRKRSYHALLNIINLSQGLNILPEFNGQPTRMDWIHTGRQDEHFALHVHRLDSGGSIVLQFDLDLDLFGGELRRQAPAHLLQVLDSFLADSGRPLDDGSLLASESQRKRRLTLEEEAGFDF